MEAPVLIPNGSGTLYGMLYRPAAGCAPCGVVMCNPLFEERKGAQRIMVETARALAAAGYPVLRFDYRGTGDSAGDESEASCAAWRADIQVASRYLEQHVGVSQVGRLGVRLGASLMVETAPTSMPVAFSVLWAPVSSGRSYFDQELRRKLVKEMVTFGQSRVTRASLLQALKDGKPIDLDGYAVTPTLYDGINAINMPAIEAPVTGQRILLIQIASSETASAETTSLGGRMEQTGAQVDIVAAKEDPFWNLVGLVECPALVARTVHWITGVTQWSSRSDSR